uniref:Rieske domain-containing protein n=1 Tax=Panagrellus redivivus TaxID=6233 RepID=A0A7E4ZQ74_PANRE
MYRAARRTLLSPLPVVYPGDICMGTVSSDDDKSDTNSGGTRNNSVDVSGYADSHALGRRRMTHDIIDKVENSPVEVKLCHIYELQNGEMKECAVTVDSNKGPVNLRLLVVKHKGKWYCLGADCTYCGAPLVNGFLTFGRLRCSLHGTAFNLKTGKLEDPPGFDSLPSFPVIISKTDVCITSTIQRLLQHAVVTPMCRATDGVSDPVVIVGAGLAGVTCAEALRQEGFNGRIMLISKDDLLPYNRSILSKLGAENAKIEDITFRTREFYETHGIELILSNPVKNVNVEDKIITLSDDQKLTYSDLVLAMGTNNRLSTITNSNDLDGVYQLKDIEDLWKMREGIEKKHVAIVGAGFNALEQASSISPHTRSVTVHCKSETPLKSFGVPFGRALRAFIDDETNVRIRLQSTIRSFDGFDRIEHVVVKDGLCAVAQAAIIAIGIQPCSSLLMKSKIQTDGEGFIKVDSKMTTTVPNVYAIGDIATFPQRNGVCANLPHIQAAQFQARTAALSITGKNNTEEKNTCFVPVMWISLFGIVARFSGDPITQPTEYIARGTLKDKTFVCYHFKKEELISVVDACTESIAIQFIDIFKKKIKITYDDVKR